VNYRTLGRTGLEVSEVGYGAWGIAGDAWLGAKDEESLKALNRAVDLGLNFVDTALAYGEGHSERLVGKLVQERDETIHVATKVPPKNRVWPAPEGIAPEEAFPGDYIRECTEQSLSNLGLYTIDVQQFHVWQDDWVGKGDWLEAVEDLKREGKIRAFGVSINDHQASNAVRLIETGAVDTVQVIYNVFDQSPEDRLLPACQERDVGVIVRVPFDEGSLTGRITPDTTFEVGDFRNDYFRGERKQEVYDRVLNHLYSVVDEYQVPDPLRKRFEWLADGDVNAYQTLLNYFLNQDRELAVSTFRKKLPVLLHHLRANPSLQRDVGTLAEEAALLVAQPSVRVADAP
jgi:aryl-alcohol dehydrogenase-like predicted oxidoreductase